MAVSYLAELMHVLLYKMLKATPNILKVEVKYRHINNKVYGVYIDYIPHCTNHNNIRRNCCKCRNGNHTVDRYLHVTAIVN